ncbi:amino acid adenylation domain-containing protein [Paenibacillus oenotherae]|uniref:Amino acid adenylation domain-containing protein n=1 Tax=Paenibacillus oenotherae TaxID=1435645 RepID=A0ABS7DBJ9_9BACL|nr:non-ribosomal peptide synthetase [Paenibacillus oenotherae]MBW7477118.1 amino acid adenylation domain-containing protein [Paenibacillus oenotherae]
MNRDAIAPAGWEQSTTEEFRQAELYWLDKLRDLPTAPSFQGDSVKHADKSEGIHRCSMPPALSEALLQRCKGNDGLISVFLVSVLQTLVCKVTAQRDIIIGSPIHTAYAQDEDDNSFVLLRSLMSGEMTCKEVLQSVKLNVADAYNYQYYPIGKLLDKLGLANEPVFRIVFAYDAIHGQALKPRELPHNDLVFRFSRNDAATQILEFEIQYDALRFKQTTIETIASALCRLLDQFLHHPDLSVNQLELVAEEEKHQITNQFNQTDTPYASHLSASRLFERIASEHPGRTAVVSGEFRLTYAELNERANRLAHVLADKGVGPDVIVALIADRTAERIIAMLAILKAGGAFLPVDPSYPAERIAYMLQDSGAGLAIADMKYTSLLPEELHVLDLQDAADEEKGSSENLQADPSPEHLAYMIYTSGSTGLPKGVMLQHRGLAALKETFSQELAITPEDAIVQFASPSFDASVWEMFMALHTGAELHMVPEDTVNSFEAFASYLHANGITVVTLPPNYLAYLNPEDTGSLRMVITAGSAVSSELVRKWSAEIEFINAYGPTEATICATMWSSKGTRSRFENGREFENGTVPIGTPILNNRIYILNHEHQHMPLGLAGELYISSPGIARGYRNREELSREKFVADPYRTGSRMYGTGDMARWLPDGNIEYLGRLDDQLKIRGFRIELGEIENRLSAYSGLTQGVVIARQEEGGAVLYAYYVSEDAISTPELRAFMSEQLPDYMIPSFFYRMDQLPLTPNGKVDRKALPDPEQFTANSSAAEGDDAPSTRFEEELLQIWKKTLRRDGIGVRENFFEIGGHSLKAMTMISDIYAAFGRQVTISQFMEAPTIEALARIIESGEEVERIVIEPAPPSDRYPLSPAQTRMFILSGHEGTGVAYNIPIFMEIRGTIDPGRLENAARQLIQRHESLRTSFHWQDGEPVQIIHEQPTFKLSVVQASESEVEDRTKAFLQPFDLGHAPLLRMELLLIQSDRAILLVDMHHIISDGVSVANLLRDYMALYEGKELAPLAIQYKDYAVWQQKQVEIGSVAVHESYWKSVFAEAAPPVLLPLDYERPELSSYAGERLRARLDASQREQLNQLTSLTGTTVYMALLAIYSITLSKLALQNDIVVGTPVAGRPVAEVNDIVGMFVNMLPMRSAPLSSKPFLAYLAEVKETVLSAFQHQQYPFDEMVHALKIRREPGINPLFNVSFALQNMDMPRFDLEDISVRTYGDTVSAAKFDLTLWATEDEDGIGFELEYASSLFKRESAELFMEALLQVAGKVMEQPESLLGQIDIVDEGLKSQLLGSIAQTEDALDIDFDL